jgi:hypothetical protein
MTRAATLVAVILSLLSAPIMAGAAGLPTAKAIEE